MMIAKMHEEFSFTRVVTSVRAFGLVIVAVLSCGSTAFASLHPGDQVGVTVLNHPELSGPVTLDASGNVSLPVAGTVQAASLEPDQLAELIRDRLAPYVRQPAVLVQLQQQSQSVFVSGGPSGVLRYQPGETLGSILDQLELTPVDRPQTAVNPNDYAVPQTQRVTNGVADLFDGPIDFTKVTILRDNRQLGPFNLVALRDAGQPGPALLPDDTIQLVNKPIAVRVSGDVLTPGVAYLDAQDPLSRALDQLGGAAPTSTETSITLMRGGVPDIVSLGGPTLAQPAQNGDALIVPRAPRVDVLGTVVKPGETYLRGDQSLVAAIYYAGGPDKYANLKYVQVIHDGTRIEYNLRNVQKGRAGSNPVLSDGDVVFVPQGSTIDAQSIFQALGAVSGFGWLIYR